MTWKIRTYKLTGTTPLLMHNGQLAAPGNKWSRLMKEITSKRNKTDADYEELARLEFFGGLYMTQDGPIVPAENIKAMIIRAAKGERMGKDAGAGVFVNEHAILEYDGPRTAQGLWDDSRFIHSSLVKVRGSRTTRTRPMFEDWSAVVEVEHEDTFVNEADLDRWMHDAGIKIGLGDWRPEMYGRFGRFGVEVLESVEVDVSANGKVAEKVTV